jgi:hypothetical protein
VELFKQYREKIKKEQQDTYPGRWLQEILKRLKQMSFSCNKVIEYENKILELVRTKDFDLKTCKNEYDSRMFEAEFYVESFYFMAFRVREILKKKDKQRYLFPQLKGFESEGVRNVRNHLIEHPEKHGGVLSQGFGIGDDDGPRLKPGFGQNDRPESMDKGMGANASEFKHNLEKLLSTALNP